jgi:hypothetical protein
MFHDQLFKTLLETFLADFLHLAVPHLARRLDLDQYRILPTEHFTDLPRGEERRLDLVVEIPVLDSGHADTGFVHIEVEREARSGMAGAASITTWLVSPESPSRTRSTPQRPHC